MDFILDLTDTETTEATKIEQLAYYLFNNKISKSNRSIYIISDSFILDTDKQKYINSLVGSDTSTTSLMYYATNTKYNNSGLTISVSYDYSGNAYLTVGSKTYNIEWDIPSPNYTADFISSQTFNNFETYTIVDWYVNSTTKASSAAIMKEYIYRAICSESGIEYTSTAMSFDGTTAKWQGKVLNSWTQAGHSSNTYYVICVNKNGGESVQAGYDPVCYDITFSATGSEVVIDSIEEDTTGKTNSMCIYINNQNDEYKYYVKWITRSSNYTYTYRKLLTSPYLIANVNRNDESQDYIYFNVAQTIKPTLLQTSFELFQTYSFNASRSGCIDISSTSASDKMVEITYYTISNSGSALSGYYSGSKYKFTPSTHSGLVLGSFGNKTVDEIVIRDILSVSDENRISFSQDSFQSQYTCYFVDEEWNPPSISSYSFIYGAHSGNALSIDDSNGGLDIVTDVIKDYSNITSENPKHFSILIPINDNRILYYWKYYNTLNN